MYINHFEAFDAVSVDNALESIHVLSKSISLRNRNESCGRPETSNHIYLSFNWSLDYELLLQGIP